MRAFSGFALLPLFALGCGQPAPVAVGPSLEVPAGKAVVKVVSPTTETLNSNLEQPGSLHAFETAPIQAKLPGYVSKVLVDLGDAVVGPEFDSQGKMTKPGTLLAEIQIPELKAEAKQKAAEVERYSAEVEQFRQSALVEIEHRKTMEFMEAEAKSSLDRSAADIERWNSELKRIEGLVRDKVVDSQTLDETRKQAKSALANKGEIDAKIASAQAAVREARARQGRADADTLTAEAKKKVAAAEVERLQALLSYTEIRAPFSGVVSLRNVHTGHFLQPGDPKAMPLFTIARIDVLRATAEVPEATAIGAKVGAKATVRIPSLNNRELIGTITRTSGVIAPESRTLRVEVDLPNKDGSLKPGLFVKINIAATSANAKTLPATAVLFADETAYCFAVLEDGKLEKRRVQTGSTEGGRVQVIGWRKASTTAGDWQPFTGSEKVVLGGLGKLIDGQTVSVGE